ncbi:hypothetical protein PHSC3_001268 [Chlamydiales bacterium STE3]|nr:hypothetical protein PHSC3_001268 [Chlamydiales bacterium STE3]
MSIQHIIFFPNTLSQYDVLNQFTKGLMKAFQKLGISCELVVPERQDIFPFLQRIYADQPDFTLSFNGLLPNENGEFLADVLGLPHVSCLVDSAHFFAALKESPLNIITCPDRFSCTLFEEMQVNHTLFLPHAVDVDVLKAPSEPSIYESVFLGSCVDYEEILEKWKFTYPAPIVKKLIECVEATLSDPALPYQLALKNSLDSCHFREEEYFQLLMDLDLYLRGKDRVELIQSIRSCPVHIFSNNSDVWQKLLGSNSPNLIFHPPVHYEEALAIMRKSKIVLNSSPMFKQGGHERIFNGLASNALVLTNATSYVQENFEAGKELLLYQSHQKGTVDEMLQPFLQNESLRRTVAERGKQKVARLHTWDQRAQELIDRLEPMLAELADI